MGCSPHEDCCVHAAEFMNPTAEWSTLALRRNVSRFIRGMKFVVAPLAGGVPARHRR
jgi:hypothetical protein